MTAVNALQAHACIDGRPRQRSQHTRRIAIELHENQIPDLDEPVARVAGKLFVLPAWGGRLHAHVVMNFRARAAGTGVAHLPEVVFFIQPENAALGNTGDVLPEFLSLIVLAKNRDVEAYLSAAPHSFVTRSQANSMASALK